MRHILTTTLALFAWGAVQAALPEDIVWETNMDDPPIGDPAAIKGGTWKDSMLGFPKTFRLHGPNSNEMFANWSRVYSTNFTPVGRHPTTDNYIPVLATHWSVQDDNRTIYFKLDERARWSDGKPITADDYVFTFEFMSSPLIRDPFYNQLIEDYFESIEAIDEYTVKIVGKEESWRPLSDYSLYPLPRHAIDLTEDWVERDNYKAPVVAGPYTISDYTLGERLIFARNPDWWGYDHHYFQGVFNVDRIELIVIADQDRELDFFKRGQLSLYYVSSARIWATQTDFTEVERNWVRKRMVFLERPEGVSGIMMNLQVPLFQEKSFRQALQYLFPFEELNSRLMFNAYYRKASIFEGTEFASPNLQPYPYDPRSAGQLLREAGWARGSDGILQKDGRRASFVLSYSSKSFEPHLTFIQNIFRRAGIDMQLRLFEPVAYFERVREKTFDAGTISMTSGYYPEPHQYFSSEFKDRPQTNNFWSFGTPETDELIRTYRFSMDEEERLAAMHKLDEIIYDEAFIINFWSAPYMRFLYWDNVSFPEFYYPKRAQSYMEYQVFWIDPEKEKRLEEARRENRALPRGGPVEVDPYGVKARLDAAKAAADDGS